MSFSKEMLQNSFREKYIGLNALYQLKCIKFSSEGIIQFNFIQKESDLCVLRLLHNENQSTVGGDNWEICFQNTYLVF